MASGPNATSVGYSNTVTGANSGAFGTGAVVTGTGSYAVGDPNVVGDNNNVAGNNSTAVGSANNVAGANALAIGNGNNVAQANAVAIGNNVTTTRANQVAIGNAGNTYTLAGVTSAASLAAQNGPREFVTTDAAGNLAATNNVATAGSVAALDGRVNSLEQNVATLQNNVAQLQTAVRKGYEGSAVAIALGGGYLPDNKRYAISGNFGTFRGETAFGGSFLFRVSDNLVLNAGVGGRGGATFAW